MQTKVITNFTGSLTRQLNGDMNSGLAKFATSWGYDPFTKPGNLSWLYQPTDIKGSTITDAILAAKVGTPATNERYVYGIGSGSRLYKIDPTNSGSGNTPLFDTPSFISAVTSVASAFQYGADLEFFNGKIYISANSQLISTDFNGGTITTVSTLTSTKAHPMALFLGSLYIGNGNNMAEVNSANIMTTATKLSPALPTGMNITDLDVTPDGNYLQITASYADPLAVTSPTSGARGQPYALDSFIFYWNGVDAGITLVETLPSYPASALNTFLDKRYYFNTDAFGAALYEGGQKILTMPQNISPMPNAAAPNGTFLTWVSPEIVGDVSNADTSGETYSSMYYFGKLDAASPTGLWRLMRQAPSTDNQVWQTPLNMMVNNFSFSRQFVAGWGKHYFSVYEYNTDAGTSTYHFYRFVLPPAADTQPLLGVYETQTELFSKRIHVEQIRVYTEGTAANNGFRIDMIGADGEVLENGTFTYSFVAGSDETQLQGSMERINFNPTANVGFALGLRITNTGTSNMTISKIEVDWDTEGR